MAVCQDKSEKPPIVLDLTAEDRTLILGLASWQLAGVWEKAIHNVEPDDPSPAMLRGLEDAEDTAKLMRLLAAGATLEGQGLADKDGQYDLMLGLVRDARQQADAFAGARARDLRLLADGGPHRYRDLSEPPSEQEARDDYQGDFDKSLAEADRAAELERKIEAFGTALHNRHYGYGDD